MVRTQVQLPDPLYREVKRVARAQDWSIAEVIRRGAEAVVRGYPAGKEESKKGWTLPPPIPGRFLPESPEALRDAVRGSYETRMG